VIKMTARLHHHKIRGKNMLLYHRPDGKIMVHGQPHAIRREEPRIKKKGRMYT